MVKLDVDVQNGGMKLDEQFLVDFGADKNDILLAHEMRFVHLHILSYCLVSHVFRWNFKITIMIFSFQLSGRWLYIGHMVGGRLIYSLINDISSYWNKKWYILIAGNTEKK